jgi:hypothetical protein
MQAGLDAPAPKVSQQAGFVAGERDSVLDATTALDSLITKSASMFCGRRA